MISGKTEHKLIHLHSLKNLSQVWRNEVWRQLHTRLDNNCRYYTTLCFCNYFYRLRQVLVSLISTSLKDIKLSSQIFLDILKNSELLLTRLGSGFMGHDYKTYDTS